jgi:fumarylacetoacetase
METINDFTLTSWIKIPENSDFPIYNLPLGIIKHKNGKVSAAIAIGSYVVDLSALQRLGFLKEIELPDTIFDKPYLNDFIELGKPVWHSLRERVKILLKTDNGELRDNKPALSECLFKMSEIEMLMPVKVGDYTDFYSSKEHATNVGTMFRDPKNALLPNWLHLPVAYHGRASSIIVSGQNFHRPKGQIMPAGSDKPIFSPSKALDFELEMAFVIGKSTELGESVSTKEADDYIFGMTLFNDWSARDIQRWEYVPLGPFLAKNFASTTSPWLVSVDALEPFRSKAPEQDPEVLPYLKRSREDSSIDITLEVWLQPGNGDAIKICTSNYKYLYWTMEQQLAHHTINGCNIKVGDLMASGTISGPTPDTFGSLLELTWNGSKPITLPDGQERKFLQDGDTVILKGYCQNDKGRIGFGEARAKVLPALE